MVGFCDSVIGQLARVYGSERMKFVRPQSQSWFFWNSPFWRFCLLHFCIFVFSLFWKSDNWKKKVCSWGIISTAAWRRSWIIPSWSGPVSPSQIWSQNSSFLLFSAFLLSLSTSVLWRKLHPFERLSVELALTQHWNKVGKFVKFYDELESSSKKHLGL